MLILPRVIADTGKTEQGLARTEAAVEGALVDWWMLAQAKIAVLSDKSSFGYSALSLSLFNHTLPVTISRDTRFGHCAPAVWEGHLCSGRTC